MNRLKTIILLASLTALLMWAGQVLGGSAGLWFALVAAAIMNIGAYWFSDKIVLRMYHAREVNQGQAPELHAVVQDLAIRADIPTPKVYIIPEEAPNAFATGRNPQNGIVAVTEGLLRILDRREIAAVIAHELGHIKHRDTLIMAIAATFAGALSMLANAAIVEAVAAAIDSLELPLVVVDPVMIAKGGDRLLEEDAVAALIAELLPRAHIVTPNVPEAAVLAGMSIGSVEEMREAGRRILGRGCRLVLVKGGHMEGPESIDVACTPGETYELRGPRIASRSTHGTGCTLSSAIAANLARGLSDRESITRAREYLEGAIRQAPVIGRGHGPLNHFWRTVY